MYHVVFKYESNLFTFFDAYNVNIIIFIYWTESIYRNNY